MFIVLAPRLEIFCTGNQSVKYIPLNLRSNVNPKFFDLSLPEIQMMISKQEKKGEIKKENLVLSNCSSGPGFARPAQ